MIKLHFVLEKLYLVKSAKSYTILFMKTVFLFTTFNNCRVNSIQVLVLENIRINDKRDRLICPTYHMTKKSSMS